MAPLYSVARRSDKDNTSPKLFEFSFAIPAGYTVLYCDGTGVIYVQPIGNALLAGCPDMSQSVSEGEYVQGR